MHKLLVARVGEVADPEVHRILVDRLWPRGMSKAEAPWDTWIKELAPSTALRKWYGHDPERYSDFRTRYWSELEKLGAQPAVEQLLGIWKEQAVALLTATKDIEYSHVPVLRDFFLRGACG